MYQHHEESLKILEDMFQGREEVIALVFGGSVAKGCLLYTSEPDEGLDLKKLLDAAKIYTMAMLTLNDCEISGNPQV